MKQLTKILAVAAIGFGAAGAVHAQSSPATTTFNVTANVLAACTVRAFDLNFGDYNPAAGDLDQQTTIEVTCTNQHAYTVDVGANPLARAMTNLAGNSSLNYELYGDSGRTTAFGLSASGTGSAVTHFVYGRIPGGQYSARSGAHSGTVNVSVNY